MYLYFAKEILNLYFLSTLGMLEEHFPSRQTIFYLLKPQSCNSEFAIMQYVIMKIVEE